MWRGGGSQGGGPAHDPLLPHAYLQGGGVSGGLRVWRYVCDNSVFAVICLANLVLKAWTV